MPVIDAEILKDVVPKPPTGPAGFDIHYDVKGDANIEAGATNVEMQLNEKSLADARARNEGGSNKQISELIPAKPSFGSALSFAESQRSNADTAYQKLFSKRGLDTLAERSTSPMPQQGGARRRDYRNVLSANNVLAKNPLMRVKVRKMLQLRKTFDQIAQQKKKSVALNPENLPQTARQKIVESALAKGQHSTPFGEIPASLQKAGKVAYNAWAKWDNVGALAAGSFINLAARLKRT